MDFNAPVLIIGGGIGGLSLAAGLAKVGVPHRVFERAPALGEVGAGIGLWTNAIRGLNTLGVEIDSLAERSSEVRRGEAASAAGRVLTAMNVGEIADAFGAPSYVVHRGELHATIAAAVDASVVELSALAVEVSSSDDGARVRFEDGREVEGSVVVGADGLFSAVRASLFGDAPPRYSGETCFRGIAEHDAREPDMLREVQGHGRRCCVAPLGDGRVYWWATERAPEGREIPEAERKPHLRAAFEGFAFGFPEALEDTAPEAILQHDLFDRPPIARWSKGSATLMGDAAHPTTPNLGQGACMAIEDAVVLTRCLVEAETPAEAFATYEAERRDRCYRIVKQSRLFGRVGSWSNPVAVWMRETLNRMAPASAVQRTLREQLGYDPGPLPSTP